MSDKLQVASQTVIHGMFSTPMPQSKWDAAGPPVSFEYARSDHSRTALTHETAAGLLQMLQDALNHSTIVGC